MELTGRAKLLRAYLGESDKVRHRPMYEILVQEAKSLAESERRIIKMVDYLKQKQEASGVRLLWGTANCFSHPRYMNGAASNPDFHVVAHAGAQVKIALDATIALGGENYVFWGGREGYMSLLNTDVKRELDHLGRFLGLARDYARAQGFKGTFFIEPKPMEPMKHQYDYDAATVIAREVRRRWLAASPAGV